MSNRPNRARRTKMDLVLRCAHAAVSNSALLICAITYLHLTAPTQAARSQLPAPTVDALDAIVGKWQGDVVNGRSTRSDCVWTPLRTAVLCEQTITTSDGVQHALNLFTFEPATSRYFLYVVSKPGNPPNTATIAIDGKRWTYGGGPAPAGQRRTRTINDFSARDSYDWWTETSDDGEHWTRVMGGRSTRVTAGKER